MLLHKRHEVFRSLPGEDDRFSAKQTELGPSEIEDIRKPG
jgi:hypothetical protein